MGVVEMIGVCIGSRLDNFWQINLYVQLWTGTHLHKTRHQETNYSLQLNLPPTPLTHTPGYNWYTQSLWYILEPYIHTWVVS